MPRKNLSEAGALGKIEEAGSDGTFPIQVITPGWGSSGYYSAQVLEAAGKAKVWPAGTHMYLDHPTAQEDAERPARSVKDLTAVLTEDASWNGGALVARVRPAGIGRTLLEDETFRAAVGVSVRASAIGDVGEAEGRRGWIVEELLPSTFNSVDVVTHAGRGGKILEVLEAAHAQLSEATSNDTREALHDALKEAYGGEKSWVWVRDFDDSTVWFEHETPDSCGVFAQTYSLSAESVATLTGERVEVRARTVYVPLASTETSGAVSEAAEQPTIVPVHPAGSNPPKEHTMPEIEESRLRDLEEAHGRVPTLEAELATQTAAREAAEHRAAVAEASGYAREFGAKRVKDANSELAGPIVDKIVNEAMREITLGEDNRLDTVAFGERIDAARKAEETYLASIAENVGSVRGLGESATKKTVEPKVVTETVANVFGVARKGA